MKRYSVLALALGVALLCGSRSVDAAVCAPKALVHIVVTAVTPGINPASFEAQPRELYRIGDDKMRIEEALDAANGIHGLIVNAEPNIWMVNLYDGTGRHIVDPGPSLNVVAPIFGIQGVAPKIAGLEFGCEANFLAANAPTPSRTEQVGASRLEVYRVVDGTDAVEILERPGTGTPSFARYYQQGKLILSLRYDLYATGLPMDPSLFVRPSGVRYTEAGAPN